ncbi:MAG: hypothetical protein K1X35_05300 [Caulobacteraceae bacterium]|nr:hypothetical protein [Caulobacteraceae bacterium]
MTAVRYPIAANAEAALVAPLGRAAREREARERAGEEVIFVTEQTGPGFPTEAAAAQAWRGRVEDPVSGVGPAAEDRFCGLREVMAEGAGRPPRPQKPSMRAGRRWPQPRNAPAVVWRLAVSYWRLATAQEIRLDQARQARQARRDRAAASLTPDRLKLLADHPLRPFKPQQPLDIGLFEVRAPENPLEILPDE